MLQNIRDNTQGTMAKVIIILISIPFVLMGAESLLGNFNNSAVAEVNGEEISSQELQEAMTFEKRRRLQSMGDEVNSDLLTDESVREPALDSLVTRKLSLLTAQEMGMAISPLEVNKIIVQNEDFHEDGKFSKEKYTRLLINAGLNSEIYKRLYTSDLLNNQLASGFVNTGFVTTKTMDINNRFMQQTRDIRYIALSLEDEEKSLNPADQEVREYYESNIDKFMSEESVVVDYLEIDLADFIEPIPEERLQKAYDDEVAKAQGDVQKQVSHILIDLSESSKEEAINKLKDIKLEILDGKNFSDMAALYSEDLGTKDNGGFLGTLDPEIFPGEFVAAADLLEEGEISEPVVTDAGVHLIQMTQMLKSNVKPYEERKESLARELQLADAEPRFWAAVEEMKDITFNALDLSEPAEQLSLEIKQSEPIMRNGGVGVFTNPDIYKVAYSDEVLNDQVNSEVIQLNDKAIVLRVKEHNLPQQKPYDEVKGEAKDLLITQKAKELLRDKASDLLTQIQQGKDVEQLAKENDLDWELVLKAQRNKSGVDKAILQAAFGYPEIPATSRVVDTIQMSNGNMAIFTVDNIAYGKPMAPEEAGIVASYLGRIKGSESYSDIQEKIKAEADVKTY